MKMSHLAFFISFLFSSLFIKSETMSKRILLILLIAISFQSLWSQRSDVTIKWYGMVRNDAYINSRQNEDAIDGILHMFPKPIVLDGNGNDINAGPQSELLSVNSRIGVDIIGTPLLGAKSSAKLEFDFGGTGNLFFLAQIRHAYIQLNWEKASLVMGQTWHPLFGSVVPTVVSFNAGTPFQPFNRSPQLRFNYRVFPSITLSAVASNNMQFNVTGPVGSNTSYTRNVVRPALHANAEYKKEAVTLGGGLNYKVIKPDHLYQTSFAAVAYAQYVKPMLQIKTKATVGQNMTDMLMSGGYGKYFDDSSQKTGYTNLNVFSSFLNVVYGKKWQAGFLLGYLENLGSTISISKFDEKYIIYGRGFDSNSQQILNNIFRFTPMVMYNIGNINAGLEYDLTSASFGDTNHKAIGVNPYNVINHRLVFAVNYLF